MKTTIYSLFLFLFSLASIAAPTLNQADKEELHKGSMVTKVEWIEGHIWPEVTVFTLLKHSPKQNLDVFLDFETHKNYIPDMVESKIVKRVSQNQLQVYFEMSMPWPVKKTSHTTNNVITKNSDGSYTLKWNLVEGKMLKATDGYMNFSTFEGKTLLTYVSLIVPNSSLAGMFKNRVADDVEKTVKVISKHLMRTLDGSNQLISGQQATQNNL
jgi:ribosome-associated toxin RatA of RatAB toxin-antitoxin module